MSPFGHIAGVALESAILRVKGFGPKGSGKAGDIWIAKDRSHTGIYIGNGRKIAGNEGYSSGASSWRNSRVCNSSSAGGNFFRPKYSPDVLPITYNGKKIYYNPDTKKFCSDKEGKTPLKHSSGANALSGGTQGSGRGGSSSSGNSSNVYKEYYVTKPQNFEQAKDISYESKDAVLSESIRKIQLMKDVKKVLELYPKNSQLISLQNSLNPIYDLTANSLLTYYNKIVEILASYLIEFKESSGKCYAITGNKNDLRFAYQIDYSKRISSQEQLYYNIISNEWLELFNEISLKRDALKYYIETKVEYKSPILSNTYLSTRYNDLYNIYSIQLNNLQKEKDNYVNENIQMINTNEQLDIINKEIFDYSLKLNAKDKQLQITYLKIASINKKINDYQTYLDNLLEEKDLLQKKYFSEDYCYWNKDIIQNPQSLYFWLEFSSNGSEDYNYYNIPTIGLRSVVITDSNVNSVYKRAIPNIIYYSDKNMIKNKTGFIYLYYPDLDFNFVNTSQGVSAKDAIDDLLYQHSYCAEEISLNTIPIYYLQPNQRILVYNPETGINGEYIINKISNQLSLGGAMSISATKAVDRIY